MQKRLKNAASSLIWVAGAYAYCTKCENAEEGYY
jgi:hypothetical protein